MFAVCTGPRVECSAPQHASLPFVRSRLKPYLRYCYTQCSVSVGCSSSDADHFSQLLIYWQDAAKHLKYLNIKVFKY